VSSTFAPQNRDRVERAIREELERAVRTGFTASEVEKAGNRCSRRGAWAHAGPLARQPPGTYLFAKRTFAWTSFESKIAALTADQVNAALRRHIDPARLSVVVAGDFKKP